MQEVSSATQGGSRVHVSTTWQTGGVAFPSYPSSLVTDEDLQGRNILLSLKLSLRVSSTSL